MKLNKKIFVYIMPAVGLLILLYHAIAYLFDLNFKNPALTVLGLVFVAVGMQKVRKYKSKDICQK